VNEERVVDELALQIGARIRAFREEHGLTQTDIAERTGIPRQQIGRYEMGFEVPATRTAMVLARFMDILVDELLYGKRDEDLRITDPQLHDRFIVINRMASTCRQAAYDLLDMFILSRMDVKAKTGK
jgi:transcriptional regulator with XRE-family HTH domain